MGMTKVGLSVKNSRHPKRRFVGEFLVDSGATFTVVPAVELRKLGIKPHREESFVLDGKVIRRKVGEMQWLILTRSSPATTSFEVRQFCPKYMCLPTRLYYATGLMFGEGRQ